MLNVLRRTAQLLPLAVTLACGSQRHGAVRGVYEAAWLARSAVVARGPVGHDVGDVWMTLSDVPSDSRCPQGVACVWAGDAVAAINVHPGCYKAGCLAPSFGLNLHTQLEPKAGDALGYHVQLLAIRPEPVHDSPTDPTRYVAWVRVSR
ncbi:MAG: hypothetical protein ABI910_13525 [Gemmatimonadota bacterium]